MGKAPRRRPDAVGSVNDGREAVGPVMAVAGEAADARAIPAHHQPVAVMLDFVNPERAGRRSGHLRRQAWLDENRGHRGHAAAARSSLSAPRMTILSASSGNGCNALARFRRGAGVAAGRARRSTALDLQLI